MATSSEYKQAYFYTPALKSLVQQISHLAFFGDGISVVLGEHGSGKSSLAKELEVQFEQAHQHVSLEFDSEVELGDCLERISSELGLRLDESTSSAGELLGELRHYVQALMQDKKLVILSLDNAHFLDDQALGALISLLQGANHPNSGLHLILFSEPGLDRRIDALQIIDVAAYDFLLPNFSPTELASFLEKRPHLQSQLNSSLVQKIWSGSKGIPGKALALLGEGDTNLKSSNAAAKTEKQASANAQDEKGVVSKLGGSLPIGHIAAIVLLVVVLVSTVFLRSGEDEYVVTPIEGVGVQPVSPQAAEEADHDGLAEESASEDEDEDSALASAANDVDETSDSESFRKEQQNEERLVEESEDSSNVNGSDATDSLAVPSLQEGAEVNESSMGVAQHGASREAKSSELEDSENTNDLKASQKKPEGEATEAATSDLSQDEEDQPSINQGTLQVPTLSAGKSLTEPEIFLLAQNPDFYTLQVVAASKRESLDAYIARQSNRDSLYIYRGTRESKSWYVVVQGVYSSREAAMQARRTLPSEQAKAGPWPRQLSSIQEEIEDFRYK